MKKYLLTLFILPVLFLVLSSYPIRVEATLPTFTLNSPTTPTTWSRNPKTVNFTLSNYVVGTQISIELVQQLSPTNEMSRWSWPLVDSTGSDGPRTFSANVTPNDPSTFPAGTYFLRLSVPGAQTFKSGDITLTDAPDPRIWDLATDKTNYVKDETININWQTNITEKSDLVLKRYKVETNPPDTLIGSTEPNNLLSHSLVVGNTFVDRESYYYTLSKVAGTASDKSNTFTIGGGNGTGPSCGNNQCETGETHASCPTDCTGGSPTGTPPGWKEPPNEPPKCDDPNTPGCWPPVNVSNIFQAKFGALQVDGFHTRAGAIFDDVICLGGVCRNNWPTGGTGGGVSSITAGTPNVTLSGNTGDVIISVTGGAPTNLPTCSDGQVLKWSGGVWSCGTDLTGGGDFNSSGIVNCTDLINDKIYWDGAKLVCGTDQTGGSGGYNRIYDGGTPLTQRSTLKFYGTGITCVDNVSTGLTECNVPGGDNTPPTTYTAGPGLQLVGNQFAIKLQGVDNFKIADGAVSKEKIADKAVTNSKLSLGIHSSNLCRDDGDGIGKPLKPKFCDIGPASAYLFCALESVQLYSNFGDSQGGVCAVTLSNSTWQVKALAGVNTDDSVMCSAVCIPAT